MTETQIIWKYLTRVVDDTHPSVYVFATSYAVRSRETAIENVLKSLKDVFSPINQSIIKTVVKQYLENKRREYLKGLIVIKPLYS